MSINPDRYVEVSANGTPADPQAATDLAAASQAGAIAGDIAGREAGREAGAEAGTEVAASAGAAAGSSAGEIAGTAAGTASGAVAGAAAGGPAGAAAGAAAAGLVVATKADRDGGGNITNAATWLTNLGAAAANASNVSGSAALWRTAIAAVSSAALIAGTGAQLVGVLQTGADAVALTVETKLNGYVDARDYGVLVGSGVDQTANMQKAVDAAALQGKKLWVRGEGEILITMNANTVTPASFTVLTGSVRLPSNTHIVHDPGIIMKAQTNALGDGSIYSVIYPVQNVIIEGGTIRGDRDTHTGVTGEGQSSISVSGGRNVVVRNVTLDKWWGDGSYVSCGPFGEVSENIHYDCCVVTSSGRNGLSVIHCDGGSAVGCVFKGSDRTLPMAGVDVEPNPGQRVTNFDFIACEFIDNVETGFLAAPQSSSTLRSQVTGLRVIGCSASGSKYGFGPEADSVSYMDGPVFEGCRANGNSIYDFRVRNTKWAKFTDCHAASTATAAGWVVRGEYAASRMLFNSAVGAFVYNETLTGATSGATAAVITYVGGTILQAEVRLVTGTFANSETVTGSIGGIPTGSTAVMRGSQISEPPSFGNVFTACSAAYSTGNGFFCETTTANNWFNNCEGYSNGGLGVRFTAPDNHIRGGSFRYNTQQGVGFSAGAAGCSVIGSEISGNRDGGITVSSTASDCFIAQNRLRSLGVQAQGVGISTTSGYHRVTGNDWWGGGTSADAVITDTTTVLTNNIEVQASTVVRTFGASPEGAVSGPVGSMVRQSNATTGSSLWAKRSGTGNTGWVAIPGGKKYAPNLTPASVAANTSAEQTFAVTGLATTDIVIVNGPAPLAGTGIVGARVSAADTLAVTFANFTAGALVPNPGVHNVLAMVAA